MKFWTADSDELVVDMMECDQCDKWIPKNNWELHRLFHAQKDNVNHEDGGDNSEHSEDNVNQDNQGLPDFVMETIPCDDCHVLVPKANWEIHRAHVCRGRASQKQAEEAIDVDNPSKDHTNNHHAISLLVETVECTACGICVPLHNLELHESRACSALHAVGPTQLGSNDCSSSSPAEENTASHNERNNAVVCPQCTFRNQKSNGSSKPSVIWKCTMCDYVLSAETVQQQTRQKQTPKTDKEEGKFWQSMVQSWVPKEYHQLLPESLVPPPSEKVSRRRRTKNNQRNSGSKPSKDLHVPQRQELRYKRSTHLDWLERERQQYLTLLETTRVKYQGLKQEQQSEPIEMNQAITQQAVAADSSQSLALVQQQPPDNYETENVPDLVVGPLTTNSSEPQPQQPTKAQQLELLKATEGLCLYHLEHLRRTRVIQELKLDIQFLGLPRWRHHLHHLLDLYQSVSELSVDSIIWELRMNFIQYATLEVMALLELKIWKEQIRALMGNQMDGISVEARRACRNDVDIAIICQSVIPFMGRPQTPALRSL